MELTNWVVELTNLHVRRRVVDGNLMAKWKKPGYEVLLSSSLLFSSLELSDTTIYEP